MNDRASQELSAEARQLIANARGADDPTAEDESRVKARWLAGIAAGAGVSSLSEAVRAAASTGWSVGLKAAAVAGAAAVAAIGVYLGWPDAKSPELAAPERVARHAGSAPIAAGPTDTGSTDIGPTDIGPIAPLPTGARPIAPVPSAAPESAPPQPALERAEAPSASPEGIAAGQKAASPEPAGQATARNESPAANEPAANQAVPRVAQEAVAAAEAPPAVAARTAKPSKTARPARKAPAAEKPAEAPAAVASGQLGEEIARISEIRGQLQSGSPARALEMLTEYRRHFAEPNLAMEADALQVDALCKAGQRDAARTAATAFASRWPSSPLADRVRGACQ